MKPLIETKELTKFYGSCYANSQVSVSIAAQSIHAILGENGAGKSTFLKMLFGLIPPSSGEIHLDGQPVRWKSPQDAIRMGLGMVQQHFSLIETSSVIDNILLGAERTNSMGGLEREKAIQDLESLLPSKSLRLPWHEKVENLSVGFKQRLEILKLIYRRSKILFLDEPTAVLTPQEVEELFEILRALKSKGHTIVLITHKIREVFALCENYTVMRGGKVVGNGRVKDTTEDQMVEMIIGRKLASLNLVRKPSSGEKVLTCQEVSEPKAERGSLKSVSFEIAQGEIVGIAGVEGAGQQNLVEIIMGTRSFKGDLQILGKKSPLTPFEVRHLGTGLIPSDRHDEAVWLDQSCYVNMMIGLEDQFSRRGFIRTQEFKPVARKWAEQFRVEGPGLEASVSQLSGGNQQKLVFAREVGGRAPRFLICQHPSRGIDLGATELIHNELIGLRNEGVGILLCSGDLDELMYLSDRIIVFFEGNMVDDIPRARFDALKIGACMTGAVS